MPFLVVRTVFLTCLFLAWLPVAVPAIDHANLDEGRPLRVQDPYPIGKGEAAIEGGLGYSTHRHTPDKLLAPLYLVYGLLLNAQVEVGTTFFTNPHDAAGNGHSGDMTIAALYNFNRETLTVPALGFKAGAVIPTGVDSSHVDFEVMGLAAKSFCRLNTYLNAGYEFKSGTGSGERTGRYKVILGAGYPVGAPFHTRTLLLADVYLLQSERRGGTNTTGGEIGVRYQFTERVVLDAGAGSEFSGSADRSRFLIRTGFSFAF